MVLSALLALPPAGVVPSWRRLGLVAGFVTIGAMCFGDGLAVALVFWLIAMLHFEGRAARRRCFTVFGSLAALLPVVYLIYLRAGTFLTGQALPGAAPADVPNLVTGLQNLTVMKLEMIGYLFSAGIRSLLLGHAWTSDSAILADPVTPVCASIVVGLAVLRLGSTGRRTLAIWLAVALAAYGMIAIGRVTICLITGIPIPVAAGAPRYHYLGQVGLAGALAWSMVALLGSAGRYSRQASWLLVVLAVALVGRNVELGWRIPAQRNGEIHARLALEEIRRGIHKAEGDDACIVNHLFSGIF